MLGLRDLCKSLTLVRMGESRPFPSSCQTIVTINSTWDDDDDDWRGKAFLHGSLNARRQEDGYEPMAQSAGASIPRVPLGVP